METRNLLDSGRMVRKRVVSWFRPGATFDPASMRGVALAGSVSTTLAEVMVYMSLARSAKYGQLPGYTPDMVLAAIAGFECIAAPFISWVGYWRRQRTLMIWHLVFIAVAFTLFLLPSVDVGDGSELCTDNATVVTTPHMSGKTIVRLCMLIILGVVSSMTRLGIWSHSLGYIEEYSSAKTSMHFGIVMLARALAILQGREVVRSSVKAESMLTDILMIIGPMVLQVFMLLKFHQHAPGIKDFLKATSDQRGFLSSVIRVLTNGMAVVQMVSMGVLTSAVWGYFLYDVEMVKTKFLMASQSYGVFNLIDPLRSIVVIVAVVLAGYIYSAPVMPNLDRFASMKKAAVFSLLTIIQYMILTFVVKCTKGPLVGFDDSNYVQPNCSLRCSCDPSYDDFSPVCEVNTMMTYYSPCQAGCANYSDVHGFKVWSECACAATAGINGTFTAGACGDGTCYISYFVHQLMVALLLTCYLITIQSQGAIMIQAVDRCDKSVVVGVAAAVVTFIAFFVGHLIQSIVIKDATCAWSDRGSCRIYGEALSVILGSSSASLTAISLIISVITCVVIKRTDKEELHDNDL